MACAYCYVPRRKGYANPITLFVNIEEILGYLERHVGRQGPKTEPNQCDPHAWVYDIGENGDCSVDAAALRQRARPRRPLPAPARRQGDLRHQVRQPRPARLRPAGQDPGALLADAATRRAKVDVRTSPIAERIAAIDDFVAAGYEVHLNFSPVIVHDGWLDGVGRAARRSSTTGSAPRRRRSSRPRSSS